MVAMPQPSLVMTTLQSIICKSQERYVEQRPSEDTDTGRAYYSTQSL